MWIFEGHYPAKNDISNNMRTSQFHSSIKKLGYEIGIFFLLNHMEVGLVD